MIFCLRLIRNSISKNKILFGDIVFEQFLYKAYMLCIKITRIDTVN